MNLEVDVLAKYVERLITSKEDHRMNWLERLFGRKLDHRQQPHPVARDRRQRLRVRFGRSVACGGASGPGRSAIVGNVLLFTVFVGAAFSNAQGRRPLYGAGRPPDLLHHHQRLRLVAW